MAYNHENIIVGAADVYIGEEAAVPAVLTTGTSARVAYGAEPTGWRHVGLTSGGVEFAYAPDFGEVEVDQYLDVAKMYKQRQSVTVSTTFAEATLENLLFAWGQSEDTLTEGATAADDTVVDIAAGALGDKPLERQLVFIGQAPGAGARERVYHLLRVLSVESSTFSLSRSDATMIPVSLRCLPDSPDGTDATYGTIVERTLTA